jgi:hypothetical protein
MSMFKVAPIALVMAACASSQPEPAVTPAPTPLPVVTAVLDPVGSYEFATTVNGQFVNGTMTITGEAGAYKGRILTNMFPEIPIAGAAVEGQTMVVRANMPDGELTLNLKFDGAIFTGTWALGGESGAFNGKKLPK